MRKVAPGWKGGGKGLGCCLICAVKAGGGRGGTVMPPVTVTALLKVFWIPCDNWTAAGGGKEGMEGLDMVDGATDVSTTVGAIDGTDIAV